MSSPVRRGKKLGRDLVDTFSVLCPMSQELLCSFVWPPPASRGSWLAQGCQNFSLPQNSQLVPWPETLRALPSSLVTGLSRLCRHQGTSIACSPWTMVSQPLCGKSIPHPVCWASPGIDVQLIHLFVTLI